MKYKLSTKLPSGKWWTWGSVAENKYGKLQCSFKVTPQLVDLIRLNDGNWINFSMFEDTGSKPQKEHVVAKGNAFVDDELPF